MKISILICTIKERESLFKSLLSEFFNQGTFTKIESGYIDEKKQVEILYHSDNKEISVGKKRQLLLEKAAGKYIVFIDDDDFPSPNYIDMILSAIETNPDCIGINVAMTTNGTRPQKCCHSLKYPVWMDNVHGWDYVRNVTHFNPVKRDLAMQSGFKDMRFGEDKDYADRLTPLCKTEVYIEPPLFHYRFSNKIKHNQKYGIK